VRSISTFIFSSVLLLASTRAHAQFSAATNGVAISVEDASGSWNADAAAVLVVFSDVDGVLGSDGAVLCEACGIQSLIINLSVGFHDVVITPNGDGYLTHVYADDEHLATVSSAAALVGFVGPEDIDISQGTETAIILQHEGWEFVGPEDVDVAVEGTETVDLEYGEFATISAPSPWLH